MYISALFSCSIGLIQIVLWHQKGCLGAGHKESGTKRKQIRTKRTGQRLIHSPDTESVEAEPVFENLVQHFKTYIHQT